MLKINHLIIFIFLIISPYLIEASTIKDNNGNLWQANDYGQLFTFKEAKSYCENLIVDGSDGWILPSYNDWVDMRVAASFGNGPDPQLNNNCYWVNHIWPVTGKPAYIFNGSCQQEIEVNDNTSFLARCINIKFPLCSASSQSISFDPLDELVFDLLFYISMNPDVAKFYGDDHEAIKQHWVNSGIYEGRIASPIFNVHYYMNTYSDIADYFGTDYEGATRHWLLNGLKEGRKSSPVFDVQYYSSSNPDIYGAYGSNFELTARHWLNHGKEECRVASHDFQSSYYLNKNQDVNNVFNGSCSKAIVHWFKNGRYEQREESSGLKYAKTGIDCNEVGELDTENQNNNSSSEVTTSEIKIRPYKIGDTLKYSISYKGAYDDGSGLVDYSAIQNIFFTHSEYENYLIKQISSINYEDIYFSISTHYYFDPFGSGTWIDKLNDGTNANPDLNSQIGVNILPGALEIGLSWNSNYINFIDDKQTKYNINENYSITGKETLTTPKGSIETFKIIYSGRGEEITSDPIFLRILHNYSGIIWYAPDIGIIKQSYSGIRNSYGFNYRYSSSLNLIDYSFVD